MKYKTLDSVGALVVHCSATTPDMDIGVDEIRRWHQQRGWSDIGYHRVYRRNGAVEYGRPETAQGAHARGWNHISLGLCLVGGVNRHGKAENNFTPEQFDALWHDLAILTRRYPEAIVVGHRDLPGVVKACPCFDVQEWWADQPRYGVEYDPEGSDS